MGCPRCDKPVSFMRDKIEDSIKHIKHCIWCQTMDEKLDMAKNNYYCSLGSKKRTYRWHNNKPSIYDVLRQLQQAIFNLKD